MGKVKKSYRITLDGPKRLQILWRTPIQRETCGPMVAAEFTVNFDDQRVAPPTADELSEGRQVGADARRDCVR